MILGCKDIGIIKSEFVAKTQFLCYKLNSKFETEFKNVMYLFKYQYYSFSKNKGISFATNLDFLIPISLQPNVI